MTNIADFSATQLEAKPGSHVYIPDFPDDYRSIYTGKILKTINNPNPEFETDIVNHVTLPPFCTATSNPGPGSYMIIKYVAREKLIEVFTFEKYINSFIGHMMVRDVEYLTQEFAREIATALGQGVYVEAYYNLVGFKYGQAVTISVKITDAQALKFRQEYAPKYQKFLDEQEEKKQAKAQASKASDTAKAPSKCPVDHKALAKANSSNASAGTCPVGKHLTNSEDSTVDTSAPVTSAQASVPVTESASINSASSTVREPDYTKICPMTGELGCTCPPKADAPTATNTVVDDDTKV